MESALKKVSYYIVFSLLQLISNKTFGQIIYVSSTIGNDANSGLCIDSPVSTIANALEKGDTILLKAGDVFFESLYTSKKKVGRYGEGDNPVLCGYKRIVDENKWEKVGINIWRLRLADDNFTGNVKEKGTSMVNNIGCIHEYDTDKIHGRRLQFLKDLSEDWDFWQTERFDKDIPASEFDWIYMYCTNDPRTMKLEFAIRTNAAWVSETTIEDIDFVGFGFGIGCGTKMVVKNCNIDAVGGRLFVGYSNFVCYGNGLEFYVSYDIEECLVEGCHISRCYDCGVTIQGDGGGRATPRNIIVRNNLIEQCCQAWEDFLRNDEDIVYDNCVFEDNVIINSGNTTGFGYSRGRFKFCHVLGNNYKGNKGMIIRNNTFVGGNFYCSGAFQGNYQSNVWQNNKCVIKRGDFVLGNYGGTKDVIRIPTDKGDFKTLTDATKDAIRRYRYLTGDESTRFVIKSERSIKKKATKLKKHFMNR